MKITPVLPVKPVGVQVEFTMAEWSSLQAVCSRNVGGNWASETIQTMIDIGTAKFVVNYVKSNS